MLVVILVRTKFKMEGCYEEKNTPATRISEAHADQLEEANFNEGWGRTIGRASVEAFPLKYRVQRSRALQGLPLTAAEGTF